MTEIKFCEIEFYLPAQINKAQRDEVFEDILEFAIRNNIVANGAAPGQVGKLFKLTNVKDGKAYTFQVGDTNPFTGQLILAILRGRQFYAVINFDIINRSFGYSMLSFNNNTEVIYFPFEKAALESQDEQE